MKQPKAMILGDFRELIDSAWHSQLVHRQNRARSRRDSPSRVFGVEVQGHRIHVCEDRRRPGVADYVDGSDEREGRDDDFIARADVVGAEREFQRLEERRTDSTLLDYNADWTDYQAAGATGPEDMELRIAEMLKTVELEETIFELGLRSAVDPADYPGLAENVLRARDAMRARLAAPGMQGLVELFDAGRYNRNATLAENLLFGTPIGRKSFDIENLASSAYVRRVLHETGLAEDLLRMGHKLGETMVELFSGLPPGHEFFERFSFIRQDDLPEVKAVLGRVTDGGLDGIEEADRDLLLALPFKMIPARHRLGLMDEAYEARLLKARGYFREHLPADMKNAVEFFDPDRYNGSATLQDNILFGKIVTGQAEGRVMSALYEGLTVKHPETLAALPGVAERWELAPDGLHDVLVSAMFAVG